MGNFTTAQVIAWNEDIGRGIAFDGYSDSIRFSLEEVHPEDRPFIGKGSRIIVNETGLIELDTQAFVRYRRMIVKAGKDIA